MFAYFTPSRRPVSLRITRRESDMLHAAQWVSVPMTTARLASSCGRFAIESARWLATRPGSGRGGAGGCPRWSCLQRVLTNINEQVPQNVLNTLRKLKIICVNMALVYQFGHYTCFFKKQSWGKEKISYENWGQKKIKFMSNQKNKRLECLKCRGLFTWQIRFIDWNFEFLFEWKYTQISL